MREIRRHPDFVLFLVYIVFVISNFRQCCSTWWVRHSYCTISFYCQCFPNLKISYKKAFAFMLKFYVFAFLMHLKSRFCCHLWSLKLTNISSLMKNFIIFKENVQKSSLSCKIKFCEICNLQGFDLQKHLPQKFPGRH